MQFLPWIRLFGPTLFYMKCVILGAKLLLYERMASPVFMYLFKSWVLNKKNWDRLAELDRKTLRRIWTDGSISEKIQLIKF